MGSVSGWMLAMLPEPLVKEIDVLPVKVQTGIVIVPVPLALIVSTVPLAFAPSRMAPLLAVVDNDSAPDELSDVAAVNPWSVETDRALNVPPVDERLKPAAVLFMTVAVPVVLR